MFCSSHAFAVRLLPCCHRCCCFARAKIEDAGGEVHVGIRVAHTAGGIGVVVIDPVAAHTPLFSLPTSTMLTGSGANGTGIPVTLIMERRSPSSNVAKKYIKTLQMDCPPNLAVANADDLKLAAQSLHSWKVQLLEAQRVALDAELPDATAEERRWGQCMMLSRALMHQGKGTVMMPFFDLLNHGDSAYHQSFPNKAVAVAARDLKAGEEITFPYVESPSKARLLTSFGFTEGAPAASLVRISSL